MTGSWGHTVLASRDGRAKTDLPAPVHVDDVKTPKKTASGRQSASREQG